VKVVTVVTVVTVVKVVTAVTVVTKVTKQHFSSKNYLHQKKIMMKEKLNCVDTQKLKL
jgi:hypothetical protein